MNLHSIRQALRAKTVYDIPLRVAYYTRVSSESDEQLNFLDNRISCYDLVCQKLAWELVEGHINEVLSTAAKKREKFHRVVEDGAVRLPRYGFLWLMEA